MDALSTFVCTVHGSTRATDILACYQFVHSGTRACEAQRQTWWTALDRYISALPRRNQLIIIGDLNTSVPHIPHLVGSVQFRWDNTVITGPQHSDAHLLGDIMKQHHLCALTTFNGCGPT